MKTLPPIVLIATIAGCGAGNQTFLEEGGVGEEDLDPDSAAAPDGGAGCLDSRECEKGASCSAGACVSNSPGGTCGIDNDCVGEESCMNGTCGCASEAYDAENVPPNVVIALDRSMSMQCEIAGSSRWDLAVSAIQTLLMETFGEVRFGLMFFPGEDVTMGGCGGGFGGGFCGGGGGGMSICPEPGAVEIDPAPGTFADVNEALTAGDACGFGTPTAEALGVLVDYDGLADADRGNYVLLVTDGASTCDEPVPQIEALRARTPEVRTIVVGFGDGVDPAELEAMGDAGGAAGPGATSYYLAEDADSLAEALSAIGDRIRSCTYSLGKAPPDPKRLYVFFGDELLDRDPDRDEGWEYDPESNAITFFGDACDTLRDGDAGELVVVYGCPVIPLE